MLVMKQMGPSKNVTTAVCQRGIGETFGDGKQGDSKAIADDVKARLYLSVKLSVCDISRPRRPPVRSQIWLQPYRRGKGLYRKPANEGTAAFGLCIRSLEPTRQCLPGAVVACLGCLQCWPARPHWHSLGGWESARLKSFCLFCLSPQFQYSPACVFHISIRAGTWCLLSH